MRLLHVRRILSNDVIRNQWKAARTRSTQASTNIDHLHLEKEKLPSPNFEDSKEAFGGKSMKELFRAYCVFNLCSTEFLVKHQFTLLNWTRKVFGKRIFEGLMRSTVYGQFLAGDNKAEVLESAKQHSDHQVAPMFQYTAKETHGLGRAEMLEDCERWNNNFQALKDSLEIGSAARTNEKCIKVSGKLTFLTSTDVLRKATSMVDLYSYVMSYAVSDVTEQQQQLLRDAVKDTLTSLHQKNPFDLVLPRVSLSKDTVDSYATNMASHLALLNNRDVSALIKEYNKDQEMVTFTENEKKELLKLITWMQDLGEKASNEGVCFLVDAEQSYLQLALDIIALDLKRQFNQSRAVVHNTYQCYRKRTLDIVERDLKITTDEQICFGAKVVRGAYIDEERKLADELGTEDPINGTYDATTEMYHQVAVHLLRHLVATNERKPEFTFATHNLDSVKLIIKKMEELQVNHNSANVGFAQLLGMRDYIAFPLGKAGFSANKLLHYGPVEDAVAYMSRRLAENKAGVATANLERQLLGKELRRRINPLRQ